MSEKKKVEHIAFIMDGNGRWAKARNLPRHLGHKAGCDRIIEIYEECYKLGIKAISLYAFSTENWNRPKDEIKHLFNYLDIFFKKEIDRMVRDGCAMVISGDISRLPKKTQKTIKNAQEKTKDCNKFYFNICLNYGGKAEILRAAKLLAKDAIDGKVNLDSVTEEDFSNYLYTKDLPSVDLLVRTSGEQRTSNFLPWQLAYSEFVFTKTPWPDYTKEELHKSLDEYYSRDRRYGGIKDE